MWSGACLWQKKNSWTCSGIYGKVTTPFVDNTGINLLGVEERAEGSGWDLWETETPGNCTRGARGNCVREQCQHPKCTITWTCVREPAIGILKERDAGEKDPQKEAFHFWFWVWHSRSERRTRTHRKCQIYLLILIIHSAPIGPLHARSRFLRGPPAYDNKCRHGSANPHFSKLLIRMVSKLHKMYNLQAGTSILAIKQLSSRYALGPRQMTIIGPRVRLNIELNHWG